MLLVVCQLSRDAIGYEDSYALLQMGNGQLLIFGAKRRRKPFVSRFAAAADQKARSASLTAF